MYRKNSPQSVIDSYQKRQRMAPMLLAGLAAILVIVGIIILVLWFRGNGVQQIALFASATPTVTETVTPTPVTPTATASSTATETVTPTVTETATPSGPVLYTVQDGDTCWDLAQKNNVGLDILLAINSFTPGTCPIKPGQEILIPLPDTQLPTETPIPADQRGLKIDYYVKEGETLAIIAAKFNSTVDAIKAENKIEDVNVLTAGQLIVVPVNIVTPTVTVAATSTNTPGGPTNTPGGPTETPRPAATTVVAPTRAGATATATPKQP